MTEISRIFQRNISRPIDGVIKADDFESLQAELEEYVITNEIAKNISKFLTEYNNYTTSNGVWISGFFGSGKSHLLKLLSIVIDDKKINEASSADIFIKKCEEQDSFLGAELKKAVSFPSKSILFNIDQKAAVISNNDFDKLLSVFQSVLDEACGYHKEGYMAKFERDLEEKGLYEEFKEEFTKASPENKPWEIGREEALFFPDPINKAYQIVTKQTDTTNVVTRYIDTYKVSVEDFANQVQSYIAKKEKKEKGFRLNFFVDEVGQFIADNTRLMLNLQTIAESLNTFCKGKAWIVVTAQEALEKVVGDISAKQSNDFSKIQARFNIRLPLTSRNVEEVIQKRLLKKKPEIENQLKLIYDQESSNFGTLLNFADGSVSLNNFKDENHFIESYPFIPYQFTLFRESIKGLSDHNAFEGRHASVGERSLLGVFRDVSIAISSKQVGAIAPFDMMYSGISSVLKTFIQSSIQVAEANLNNVFAVRVLKALFLVKYYDQFKPTLHNITILMLEAFDVNLPELKEKIKEALNILEQETYIQRNGEMYEFLTIEEKDIETEIKNTELENTDLTDTIHELVFKDIIQSPKIRYLALNINYSYATKVDGETKGYPSELGINIITPFNNAGGGNETTIAESMNSDDLYILLETNENFIKDIQLYKKTTKYIRQNSRDGMDVTRSQIINAKGTQNQIRYKSIKQQAEKLVSNAKLFIRAEELNINNSDPKLRIQNAFQMLVDKVYNNLSLLRGRDYTENDIAKFYTDAKEGIIGELDQTLTEAQQSIYDFIQQQSRLSVKVTLKSIEEKYKKKSFGWTSAAIAANIAALCGLNKVEARQNSNMLDNQGLIGALKSSVGHENIIFEVQKGYTQSQTRSLKDFISDFFGEPPKTSDPRGLVNEAKENFKNLLSILDSHLQLRSRYEFLSQLVDIKSNYETIIIKDIDWFMTSRTDMDNDLLDLKENIVDPIQKFFNGPQQKIFDDASSYLNDNSTNFNIVGKGLADKIHELLCDQNCFKNNTMQQVTQKLNDLKNLVNGELIKKREVAIQILEKLETDLNNNSDFMNADEDKKSSSNNEFLKVRNSIDKEKIIPLIDTSINDFRDNIYPSILVNLTSNGGDISLIEIVSARSIRFSTKKTILETEADVDQYSNDFKEALKNEIRLGKKVST